ncbi:MAG: PKD domain-containing protein, partial [Bacteroidales bacterium]|nr:PKD domain-containing protein [Bacteroidales bacterium]
LEYEHPHGLLPDIHINEVGFAFREGLFSWLGPEGFGSSQWCEVNVNCPEGANWKNEKRGVAHILVKSGGGTYLCSGSLINTTAYDLRPYFLTADHCGQDATPLELEQWVFYFNYESNGCTNPPVEPPHDEMTGCSRLASSGGSGGSISGADFFLVMLDDSVPPQYNPYFNGWSRANTASPSGVSIHHPAGDIKKISTYTQPTYTTQWGGTQGTHWGVRWAATVTNQGVTEGGSSGSPLFNDEGHIIGVLSGGDASCSAQTEPDLYGKISYAWNNGVTPDRRLADWLDPLGTGATSVSGTYGSTVFVVADFDADTTVIPVNSTLNFYDRSFGDPTSWHWTFEGGQPSESESQNPSGILFEQTGSFTVTLTATNGETTDENIKLAYIKVFPTIYYDAQANE